MDPSGSPARGNGHADQIAGSARFSPGAKPLLSGFYFFPSSSQLSAPPIRLILSGTLLRTRSRSRRYWDDRTSNGYIYNHNSSGEMDYLPKLQGPPKSLRNGFCSTDVYTVSLLYILYTCLKPFFFNHIHTNNRHSWNIYLKIYACVLGYVTSSCPAIQYQA